MKLTAAQRRALEAVRDGKASRVYTAKGNTVHAPGVGAASLLRLESMKLIREGRGAGKWPTRFSFELTDTGKSALGAVAGSEFYVYKRGRRGWHPPVEFSNYADAEIAARNLCPRNQEVYAEPGHDLPRAFFGSLGGRGWSAMITTVKLHDRVAS